MRVPPRITLVQSSFYQNHKTCTKRNEHKACLVCNARAAIETLFLPFVTDKVCAHEELKREVKASASPRSCFALLLTGMKRILKKKEN